MQFSTVAAAAALSATTLAAYANTTVTGVTTITDYTTYCPESTVITITHCDEVCYPTAITVTSATTLTITGTVVVPTECVPVSTSTYYPGNNSTVAPTVAPTYSGAANQKVAGVAAGFVAIAAALL